MGNNQNENYSKNFRLEDWYLEKTNQNSFIWRSIRDPAYKIQQFALQISSEDDFKRQKTIFDLRKYHNQLVAGIYLSSKQSNHLCSWTYTQKIYLQKISVRLTDIEHIPFSDYLHVISQCLRGFSILANLMGYFRVQQAFIGINDFAVVKIWMNKNFQKSYLQCQKISQQQMVNNIIQIIDKNFDHSQLPINIPTFKQFINKKIDKKYFQSTINLFQIYKKIYCSNINHQRLQSIAKLNNIEIIINRNISSHSSEINYSHSQYGQKRELIDSNIYNFLQKRRNDDPRPYIVNISKKQMQLDRNSFQTQNIHIQEKNHKANNLQTNSTVLPSYLFNYQKEQFLPKQCSSLNTSNHLKENTKVIKVNPTNNVINQKLKRQQKKLKKALKNSLVSQAINLIAHKPSILMEINKFQVKKQSEQSTNYPYNFPNQSLNITTKQWQNNWYKDNKYDQKIMNNYNNNKDYKLLGTDDGKSSPQFYALLNQINFKKDNNLQIKYIQSKPLSFHQIINQEIKIQKINQQPIIEYKNPFLYTGDSHQSIQKHQSLYEITKQVDSPIIDTKYQQQFGRNAVSKILQVQSNYQSTQNPKSHPFKFQNNIPMKYSIFEHQQSLSPIYISKAYENYLDPDLLLDIRKLKQ